MRLLQVSELLGSLPDLSQEEGLRGEGAEPEKKSSDRALHPEDELADLAINTGETEVLSDIFGLDLRREGGQYKLTPHDPNASLTHLLISPPPAAIPSPELRQRHQVSHQSFCSHTVHFVTAGSLFPQLLLSPHFDQNGEKAGGG